MTESMVDARIESPATRHPSRLRINPVIRLIAPIPLTVVLLLTLDWVSATTALISSVALLALGGVISARTLRLALPVLIAAPLTGVSMVLYGAASGETLWRFGIIHITEGSVEIGLATAARVAAIALPAVLLFAGVDPTDLADGMAQILRLPSRFVIGALAGLRLIGLFMEDWRSLSLARRARGVWDHGRVRRFFGQTSALFVVAIRRGSSLATAMEARGFGGPTPRSWARESRLGRGDIYALVAGVFVAGLALGVSVITGSWNFVLA